MRLRIMAALGALALAATLGMAGSAHAAPRTPPPPLTPLTDISFAGAGHYMSACATVGDYVRFETPTSCIDNHWTAELKGTTGGNYYYIHPSLNLNLCVTASTTVFGAIKLEACVNYRNQWWWNPDNGYGLYHWNNYYFDLYLLDPTGVNGVKASLTTTQTCAFVSNGCTFEQS